MSSRSTRRQTLEAPPPTRASRSRLNVGTTEPEQGDTDTEEDDLTPEPDASSRSRPPARGAIRGRGRGRGGVKGRERTGTGTGEESEEGGKNLRLRKSVSYREIPDAVEDEEEDDGDGDEGDNGEEEEEEDEGPDMPEAVLPGTPPRRAKDSQKPNESASKREAERIGSGRGGFSVKGAASAAARARWAKYRSAKEDESDDGEVRRNKPRGSGAMNTMSRKDRGALADKLVEGTTIEIKGKEYTVGDDELILEDDEKGDLKVDAEGNMLGGREYRLVTFMSPTRKNPKKMYALTVDAARACGYSDSLAFLRRCPQIIKLACDAEERQMLIDIGRVTGNLKNRMVTMVSMRNVYKLMGARVVKNGKWVADDYYEDKAMTDCIENGFTPFATVHENEIVSNAMSHMVPIGRQPGGPNTRDSDNIPRSVLSLAPTYTLGGPTTHFAGSGADPWSEAGWGNKRQKLKSMGVSEEDWMYRTALETRAVDEQLKEYREDRLARLEGRDMAGWVWTVQKIADGDITIVELDKGEVDEGKGEREMTAEWLKPPVPERRRSGLSQEVVLEEDMGEGSGQVEDEAVVEEVEMVSDSPREIRSEQGEIVIQTEEEEAEFKSRLARKAGNWEPGVVRAIIEPHTHVPHVPLYTQPLASTATRLSHHLLIQSLPDKSYTHHIQSSISGRGAKGLSSVEFVFEPMSITGEEGGEHERRLKMVRDAEEWERDLKRRRVVI